ncbi:FG-GAP repeat domain-containing protein [Engelhardtia mirabilis]|uniref:FG-GAP repeat protein n=1 Tax=Engelhardtia mirabilis TaxID=2528011 RepID=A0A518BEP5_9BACT|nr:FG-GAP repeat protein [Planctomycetes bacterium Pla133]QDU99795.1 FG-GAP repeat protein [Planctomycetes bacterium Pla86]
MKHAACPITVLAIALCPMALAQQAPFTTSLLPSPPQPNRVTVAQVDAGGTLDLLVTHPTTGQLSLWLGVGDATFNGPIPVAVGGTPFDVATGDLDGDGDLDLAVSDRVESVVRVLAGDGLGSFTLAGTWSVGASPRTVELLDMDGDGNLDAVVACHGLEGITTLFGAGDLSLPTRVDTVVGQALLHFAAGDFELDGDIDLALYHEIDIPYALLLVRNDGAGGLTADPPLIASGTGTWGVVADFTGDGYPDLAQVESEFLATEAGYFINDGSGSFPSFGGLFLAEGRIAAGDLDADGRTDLVGTQTSGALVIGANVQQLAPKASIPPYPTAGDLRDLALADFDGDGYDDAVTVHGATNRILVHRNTICPAGSSFCSLTGSLSPFGGGTQPLTLDAGPGHAGAIYVILGSFSGTSPGLPIGSVTLPLNPVDPYFDFTLTNPGAAPLTMGLGVLDADGRAQAGVAIPPGTLALIDLSVDHAYLLLDPGAAAPVTFASNAVELAF